MASINKAHNNHPWWIFIAMSVAVITGNVELTAMKLALAAAIMSTQGRHHLLHYAQLNQIALTKNQAAAIMQSLYSSHSGQGALLYRIYHL